MFKQMIVLLFVVVIQVSIMGCGKQNSREMPEAGCGTHSMLLSNAEKEFLVFFYYEVIDYIFHVYVSYG